MGRIDIQRPRLARLGAAAGLAATLALGGPLLAAPPIRLLEPAAGTTLETPAPPAGDPLQDPRLARRSLLAESFTPSRPPRLGALRSAACDVAWRADGKGPALRYERRPPYRCGLLLAATPSTIYRVERQLSTTAPGVDLVVIETRYPILDRATPNEAQDVLRLLGDRWVRRDAVVAIHRFGRTPAVAGWQRDATLFASTPATRSLVLLVADQELEEAAPPVTALFDDILVDVLSPPPDLEAALYRAVDVEAADTSSGLLHRGSVAAAAAGDATRAGRVASLRTTLFAPAQVTLGLGAPLSAAAALLVDYGPHPTSRPETRVGFSIKVRPETGDERTLWSDTLAGGAAWQAARVDLGELAGQRVAVTLVAGGGANGTGFGLWSPPRVVTPPTPGDPPNVVLVTIGGLRADRLGSSGYPRPTTPRLDELARHAVVFDTAVSPGNADRLVVPALLTGLPPTTLGLTTAARELAPETPTLAERLLARGLATVAMVADPAFAVQGLDRGFERVELWPRQTPAAPLVADARRFILDHASERFLLYLQLNDPLQPFDPPAAARERFVAATELTRFGLTPPFSVSANGEVHGCDRCGSAGKVNSAFLGLVSDLYDAEVAGVDEQLGLLFDALEAANLLDNTVIVVAGTHGELLWDHDHRFGHPKADLSDAIVRVPLIIKPAGARTEKHVRPQVRTLDLYPTLLELTGTPPAAASVFSDSLAPLLVTSSASLASERVSLSEAPVARVFGLRRDGFKLVGTQTGTGALALSLFDLERDPKELRDVAAEHREQAELLLLSALDRTVLARSGSYLLVELPSDARTFRLHVKSAGPLSAAEAVLESQVRLNPGRTTFDVAGPVGPRRWRVFRLVAPADATFDVELTVAGPTPLRLKKTLTATATTRLPSKILGDLEGRGQSDLVLVSVPSPTATR